MNLRRIIAICLLLTGLCLSACVPGKVSAPTLALTSTSPPTHTPAPTSTPAPTETPMPTDTPTPTSTLTPTPTIYPLSSEATLAEIALQEEDLIEFYQQVGIQTDGFADGSKMGITQINSWALPAFTHWSADLPPDIISDYSTVYTTERVFSKGLPTFIGFHNTAIYVFPSPDNAHAFFLADIQGMDPGFVKEMPTIGDESVAFSGRLKSSTRPIGGVIWRYREAYVLICAQLNFQVMPESLITIAQNIQERLVEVIE